MSLQHHVLPLLQLSANSIDLLEVSRDRELLHLPVFSERNPNAALEYWNLCLDVGPAPSVRYRPNPPALRDNFELGHICLENFYFSKNGYQ